MKSFTELEEDLKCYLLRLSSLWTTLLSSSNNPLSGRRRLHHCPTWGWDRDPSEGSSREQPPPREPPQNHSSPFRLSGTSPTLTSPSAWTGWSSSIWTWSGRRRCSPRCLMILRIECHSWWATNNCPAMMNMSLWSRLMESTVRIYWICLNLLQANVPTALASKDEYWYCHVQETTPTPPGTPPAVSAPPPPPPPRDPLLQSLRDVTPEQALFSSQYSAMTIK